MRLKAYRIATIAHWRCACMVGLAVERHRVATLPDDGVDDANRLSVALQNAALLSIYAIQQRRGYRFARRRRGERVKSARLHSVDKACAFGVWRIWRTPLQDSPGQKCSCCPKKRKERLPSSSAIDYLDGAQRRK